ncbi:MAG TPA: hypothetical protein VNZ45_16550, partial [Bacteroidia bacterium]|nr:hypothetical protein [Bacteroidia bacterium]
IQHKFKNYYVRTFTCYQGLDNRAEKTKIEKKGLNPNFTIRMYTVLLNQIMAWDMLHDFWNILLILRIILHYNQQLMEKGVK